MSDDNQNSTDAETLTPEQNEKLMALQSIEVGESSEQEEESRPKVSDHQQEESGSEDVHAHHYIEEPQRKSRKGLIVGIASLAVVLLVGVGGSAFWYFAVRTPDVEYEKTAAILDAMISDAKNLQDARTSLHQQSSTGIKLTSVKFTDSRIDFSDALKKITDAKGKAAEYLISQATLESSKVINKDQSVNAVYVANKKVINDYGTSSDVMYRTVYIYFSMFDKCFSDMSFVPTNDMKAVSDYDNSVKVCKDYLVHATTVPAKEFNDNVYVPFRKAMLLYIDSVHNLFIDQPDTDAYRKDMANLSQVSADMFKVDTSKIQSIESTQNSGEQLKKLKAKVEERQKVFFR